MRMRLLRILVNWSALFIPVGVFLIASRLQDGNPDPADAKVLKGEVFFWNA